MLFHRIQAKAGVLAGAGDKELKLRLGILVVWALATIILVGLAIYAYQIGWSEGGKTILTIASSLVGGGGLGIILGERKASKEAGVTA